MQLSVSNSRISELVAELRQYHGYRSVWIDPQGLACHSEPDDELTALGYLYVATVLRPDRDTLADALARALPPRVSRPRDMQTAGRRAVELEPTFAPA